MVEILVLRIVHIVGGMFWVGAGLFAVLFLQPALARSGPAAGAVMANLQQRKLFTVLPVVAILTILSGLRLLAIASGGFSRAYFTTLVGATFTISALLAILAFLTGLTVARPAMARSIALSAGIPNATDDAMRAQLVAHVERLRNRGASANRFVTALIALAAVGMAIARYMV